MSTNWNWLDEIQRLADSYTRNPPKSITELLDEFTKLVPSSTGTGTGFDDFVDNVRNTKEPSVSKTHNQTSVHLYDCPACKQPVHGSVTMESVVSNNSITPDSAGFVNMQMKVTGLRADTHDCTPKITR